MLKRRTMHVLKLLTLICFCIGLLGTNAEIQVKANEAKDIIEPIPADDEEARIVQQYTNPPLLSEIDAQLVEQVAPPALQPKVLDDNTKYHLLHIAMAEAEGESTEGKALVMLAVWNRMVVSGQTAHDVIFAPNQFCIGARFNLEPNADCYAALALVESGWDESHGARWFEANWSAEKGTSWMASQGDRMIKWIVGGHTFYALAEEYR